MFAVRRCGRCRVAVNRSEAAVEADGLFGPELVCPRCGGLVQARLTPLGWAVALLAAAAIAVAVLWWQYRV